MTGSAIGMTPPARGDAGLASLRTAGAADEAATPDPSATEVLGHLLDPTVDALRGSGPVLVVATGSVWGTTADAVRLELERNGIEIAAELARDVAGDAEPEAEAVGLAGDEGGEQAVGEVRRDAGAVVGDLDSHLVAIGHRDADARRIAALHRVERVLHQIDDDLLQPDAIGDDADVLAVAAALQHGTDRADAESHRIALTDRVDHQFTTARDRLLGDDQHVEKQLDAVLRQQHVRQIPCQLGLAVLQMAARHLLRIAKVDLRPGRTCRAIGDTTELQPRRSAHRTLADQVEGELLVFGLVTRIHHLQAVDDGADRIDEVVANP